MSKFEEAYESIHEGPKNKLLLEVPVQLETPVTSGTTLEKRLNTYKNRNFFSIS